MANLNSQARLVGKGCTGYMSRSLHRNILLLSYTGQRSGHTRTKLHIFDNHQSITLACCPTNIPGEMRTCHPNFRVARQPSHSPACEHCFLACSGINFATISTGIPFSSLGLKLKRGGRKRPFGRRVFGSRSSSKKG